MESRPLKTVVLNDILNPKMLTSEKSHISFVDDSSEPFNLLNNALQLEKKYNSVNIFPHFFDYIPKLFQITTKNGSCYFNTEILAETSLIVNQILKLHNYEQRELYLNIRDENNVLQKFELLYQGKSVLFDKNDYPILMKILKKLNIKGFPVNLFYINKDFIIFDLKKDHLDLFDAKIKISEKDMYEYLKSSDKQFIISTKKRDYNCKLLGVFSSEVIRDFFIKNPNSYCYELDFADELNEFQIIADIFNFLTIEITEDNVETLNNFAEELRITAIIEKVHKFMEECEKYNQLIDEKSEVVDMIEELFDWLHHIKFLTVEKVKNLILESQWIQTEDNIKELVAFILQTIESEMQFIHFLSDLVIELDKEADDNKNKLRIFLPFLVKKVMMTFASKNSYCSFICCLMTKGVIQKEKIMKEILPIINENNNDVIFFNEDDTVIKNVLLWFLPEIFELKNDFFSSKFFNYAFSKRSYLKNYIPDKIDVYKKMRDSGEPDDEITKALRNDDVDNFQKLILPNINKISKCVVPFNIFENYIENGSTNYINYAAAYGSIKCFKYLLLNHIEIDEYTFNYAVHGCNIEIIKIVDQKSQHVLFSEKTKNIKDDKLIFPVLKHQNDLFDWIYEQKYLSKISKSLQEVLISTCAKNGNAHVLIELTNSKFDFANRIDLIYHFLQTASKNGFYRMTKLFFELMQIKLSFYAIDNRCDPNESIPFYIRMKNYDYSIPMNQNSKYKSPDSFTFESSVYFGNFSIFQLYEPLMNQISLENTISFCAKNNFTQMIIYFFDKIIKNKFIIKQTFVTKFLSFSLMHDNSDLFNLCIDGFKKNIPTFFDEYILDYEILEIACKYKHIDTAKMITDFIISQNYKDNTSRKNFTSSFIEAFGSGSFEICKYFIDKKVDIDYNTFHYSANKFKSINSEILNLLLENEPSYLKKELVCNFIQQAFNTKNYESFDILLKYCPQMDNLLYEAVNSCDFELVKIVLKYKSNPSYVNKFINQKTVLHIAVANKSIDIIQLLLSIPGIDVNKIDSNGDTPLKMAYDKCYIDIVEILLKNENVDTNILVDHGKNFILIKEIENINSKIVKLLIQHPRTNISICINSMTPLIAALKKDLIDIVELLINNEKFDPEESLLDYAFYISSGKMTKLLINVKNLDVNYILYEKQIRHINQDRNEISTYKTTLINAVEQKKTDKVSLIVNHPSFDKEKSDLSTAIYYSILNNNNDIFNILLKFVNNYDDISRVFTISTIKFKEMIILEIIDFINQNGHFIDFNRLLPNQKSFFTFIPSSYHNIQKIVHAILENGADPNIPDGFGVYPLQYAIENNSYEYVLELINSNKIDFGTKVNTQTFSEKNDDFIYIGEEEIKNNKSYLHLAAKSDKKEILSLFLDKKLIDINVTDDLGETPLMDACRYERVENIELLFEMDDLDYLHCNKNGEDALKIVLQMFKVYDFKEEINSKDEYLRLLISTFKGYCSKWIIQIL